jgi:hypothetical protein
LASEESAQTALTVTIEVVASALVLLRPPYVLLSQVTAPWLDMM